VIGLGDWLRGQRRRLRGGRKAPSRHCLDARGGGGSSGSICRQPAMTACLHLKARWRAVAPVWPRRVLSRPYHCERGQRFPSSKGGWPTGQEADTAASASWAGCLPRLSFDGGPAVARGRWRRAPAGCLRGVMWAHGLGPPGDSLRGCRRSAPFPCAPLPARKMAQLLPATRAVSSVFKAVGVTLTTYTSRARVGWCAGIVLTRRLPVRARLGFGDVLGAMSCRLL
jgi:hypothetical protein